MTSQTNGAINIVSLLKQVRHLPLLRSLSPFWRKMRSAYGIALDPLGRGVEVTIRPGITARVPRDFFDFPFDKYEPENLDATIAFLKQYPNTCVLDVGAAVGVYCACCLAASEQARVIAFDSNLSSLAEAVRTNRFLGGDQKISRVYGFVSDAHQTGVNLEGAIAAAELSQKSNRHPKHNIYVNLPTDGKEDTSIPVQSLDGLLMDSPTIKSYASRGMNFLLKMDIEGAEMKALQGAKEFLKNFRPSIALSIHPPFLPAFNTSREEIVAFVESLGYTGKFLAVDYEEHWWFRPDSNK